MFDKLMKSKHQVRAGFGNSDRVFTPPTLIPFQGCGQGNGAGPPIWVAISSILSGMIICKGFGFDFLMSISWAPLLADCFCFVDDTDVCQAALSPDQSRESVVPEVAKALTWWSNGVRLTGGAIRPDKSFWYLIGFKWNAQQGVWKFRRKGDFKPPLLPAGMSEIAVELDDFDGTPVHLQWLEPHKLAKTLGILMSLCLYRKVQLVVMKGKAKAWADQIQPSFPHQYNVLPLFCTTIQKTLEYPMALTSFSQQKWDQIQSPVLRAALPKAGICRNFPRAMVYAPIALQGVGVPHPYGLQVIKHVDMLLCHPANKTKMGAFLEAVLQAHQLETGTFYGLFQQVYATTSILASDMWAKRTWSELNSLSIHLEFDPPSLQSLHQGDQLLVDLFINSLVDQLTLKWLNWCRIFLHAVTVSDIVNAEGTAITLQAWKEIRVDSCSEIRVDSFLRCPGSGNTPPLPIPCSTVRVNYGSHPSLSPPPAVTPPSTCLAESTLTSHLYHLAKSDSHGWVPEVITIEGSEDRLVQARLVDTLRALSDGSYKAKVGIACAQILTEDRSSSGSPANPWEIGGSEFNAQQIDWPYGFSPGVELDVSGRPPETLCPPTVG
ncbi:unnamed protein product [Cylindrotheca closterium]|uniref:Uncharacterized protein n=1 Tax=Cylindrotheca closterium TaxID=2856 RepID=A0AAD2CDK3_9STRA|nr:unnamed protein product [Cylindrotheca closterium]